MTRVLVETNSFSIRNKLLRLIWNMIYWILFRPFFLNFFRIWRCSILRIFGAKIGHFSNIRSSARIWAPWNLEIGNYCSIGPATDIYNQGKIVIGDHSIISQKSYLCASTHNFNLPDFPLITKPIKIGNHVWIAADAFVGPGAKIGDGVVVGARSAVFKNIEPWTVVGGNPARFIKKRNFKMNGFARFSKRNVKLDESWPATGDQS